MGIFSKHFWKFFVGLVLLIALGYSVIIATNYYSRSQAGNVLEEQQKLAKELEVQYMNDTYGGQTPEETLDLFIDALKTGDTDLAAKYFVIEKRDTILSDLEQEFAIEENFDHLISGLALLDRTFGNNTDSDTAFFIVTDQNNVVVEQVVVAKGPNGVWKILDL